MSNFSFPHSDFYPSGELSAIFIQFKIVVYKLLRFGPVQNIIVWERVKKHRQMIHTLTFTVKLY